MPRPVVLAALLAVALPPMAWAAESAPPPRYSMEKTENGIVRMDRDTGEMSLCHTVDGKLVCAPAGEGKAASRPADGATDLEKRVSKLEADVARLEAGRRGPGGHEVDPADPPTGERSLDRAMDTLDHLVQRLFDIVDDLGQRFRSHSGSPDHTSADAQKT